MQLEAVSQSVQAYFNYPPFELDDDQVSEAYTSIALEIKKEFDKKYKPLWHCIVGENFGSFVTHENKNFIFLEIDKKSILLFKSA